MKDIFNLLKKKRAIVFDLDGTIVKLKVNWANLREILSDRYLKVYGEKIKFNKISECLDKLVMNGDDEELDNYFEIIEKYELTRIHNNEVIQKTISFIKNLELYGIPRETKLAILSLNMRKTIIKSLKLVNIYDKFDYIIGREDVRKWKPNPEGLIKIKEYFKLKNKDIIYIGDLENDILTGKNAGIDALLIYDLIKII